VIASHIPINEVLCGCDFGLCSPQRKMIMIIYGYLASLFLV